MKGKCESIEIEFSDLEKSSKKGELSDLDVMKFQLSREDSMLRKNELKETESQYIMSGIDLESRVLELSGTINEQSVDLLKRSIRCLLARDPKKLITVNISTQGGVCYDGLGLYDLLNSCSAPIKTVAEGSVMSMGLIVFMAGDIRESLENTRFMSHSAHGGFDYSGYSTQAIELAEMKFLNETMCQILGKKTKLTKKEWESKLADDCYYFGKAQAIKFGVVTTNKSKQKRKAKKK